jgi:hypothetical protein
LQLHIAICLFLNMDCTVEWSGINALLYYGPTLVESIGMRGDTITLLVSGGIGIVQFLAVIPAIIFLDQWGVFFRCLYCRVFLSFLLEGRKPLLRGSYIGCQITFSLIAVKAVAQ